MEEWPNVGDDAWFELLMGWVGSVTTVVFTNAIKEEIIKRLELDELDDDEDAQSSQVLLHDICDVHILCYCVKSVS